MNLLSGVTWKGAKLRMGEAKPDFRERYDLIRRNCLFAASHEYSSIAKEKAKDAPPARKKRRLAKGVQGVHALDMTLVTPENVQERGGWRVTPLGRIIRPIRMRPEHPLPDPMVKAVATKTRDNKKGVEKERKKRPRDPPTRARRRTIDPTKWGSQHLEGIFLDGGVVPATAQVIVENLVDESNSSDDAESSNDEAGRQEDDVLGTDETAQQPDMVEGKESLVVSTEALPSPIAQKSVLVKPRVSHVIPSSDLREEAKTTLGFLQSLFGDKDGDDWGDAESVGSDINMDEAGNVEGREEGTVVETVPRQHVDVFMRKSESSSESDESELESEPPKPAASESQPQVQKTKLKDLFAPREEEGKYTRPLNSSL